MITSDSMILTFQNYYGMEYGEGMGKIVTRYLDSLSPEVKPFLVVETFKAHSAQYKSLPDVAILESALPEALLALKESREETKYLPPPNLKGDWATEEEVDAFMADLKERMKPEAFERFRQRMSEWKPVERREPYRD